MEPLQSVVDQARVQNSLLKGREQLAFETILRMVRALLQTPR
jgi:hypothetical protein